jgi:hypothetical protein
MKKDFEIKIDRVGFNVDPDPGGKPERNRADLDPGHTSRHK